MRPPISHHADASALPPGTTAAHVTLYHAHGDGTNVVHSITVRVKPDAAGVPRLTVSALGDVEPRPVDAEAEPDTYAAAVALLAALQDAVASPLTEKRSQ